MADDTTPSEVYYRLALTVLKVRGTVTDDFDPATSKPRRTVTSDYELAVEAEPRLDWRCRLPMGKDHMRDKQFELAFADDGRLASASGTVAGAGSAVIEAAVRVGAFLGSVALSAVSPVAKALPKEQDKELAKDQEGTSFDDTLELENEALADRRAKYRTSVEALQDAVAKLGGDAARDPGKRERLLEARVLSTALETVRAEAALIEAQIASWRAVRFPSASRDMEFTVATDRLPNIVAADAEHEFDLESLSSDARAVVESLGTIVATVNEVEEDRLNFSAEALTQADGIWFRNTRPVQLALYTRELGTDGPFALQRARRAWVVDADSRLGFLRFDSGIFDKQTGTLEFGAAGSLTRVASSDEAAARSLSSALGSAPAQIKESIEQAGAVVEGLDKLRSANAERRLADLKRQTDTLEAEIALKGVLATEADREKLERLKVAVDVAEAEAKLAPAPQAPPDPDAELKQQLAHVRLQLQLRRAEAEMDWLARANDAAPR